VEFLPASANRRRHQEDFCVLNQAIGDCRRDGSVEEDVAQPENALFSGDNRGPLLAVACAFA